MNDIPRKCSIVQVKLLFHFIIHITVSGSLLHPSQAILRLFIFHIRKYCILMTRGSKLQPSKIISIEKCTKGTGGPAASLGKVLIALISLSVTERAAYDFEGVEEGGNW